MSSPQVLVLLAILKMVQLQLDTLALAIYEDSSNEGL
jgi:hypothetical protein